jgi:glycosyltransferase involved in cell wall biosynthesis
MTEKIKIIFISHNFHFLNNIIDNLNKDKYEVTIHEIKLSTNELLNPSLRIKYTSELLEIIGENQIVWVEWLLTQACLLSQVRNKTFKLICRLHSYEYFYKKNIYILSTNFQNIDKLVVVNDWFKYKLIQNFNVPKSIIINLPNQVNIFLNENLPNRQKKIGVVGFSALTNKGIDKILDIFEKIHQTDNEYTLHIKGKYNKKYSKNPFLSEDESKKLHQITIQKIDYYLEKYPEHIILHPHSSEGGEDMQTFYNQIGFLLCASIYESFHCAIMEAGSAGCIPIIYEHFQKDVPKTPEEYVIYKFKNEDDIVNFITTINEYKNKSLKIQKYYKIINKKFIEKYDELIEKIATSELVHKLPSYSIGVFLQKSNNIPLLQEKLIEISNQNTKIFLTIFINKKDYVSNNITFIKCWRKRYLFGNSSIKIPFSIKSVKIIMRELVEEDFKNYNIIL